MQLADKLTTCLRRPLVPIYGAFTAPALDFVANLSKFLYEEKILTEYTAGRHGQKAVYENVLDSLLSGVLVCFQISGHLGRNVMPVLSAS